MIKKFMFFPLWKVDELENELNKLECQGWRLVKIKFMLFYFVKSNSKDTAYIVTYNMHNDFKPNMYEYEHMLLSEYYADKISSGNISYSIFRITGKNRDFKDLIEYRNKYFQHILFQYIIGLFVLLLFFLALIIVPIVFHGITILCDIIFTLFCEIILLLLTIYCIYGYIKQRKKAKDYGTQKEHTRGRFFCV